MGSIPVRASRKIIAMESQIYCPVCHTGEVQKSRSANRWFHLPFRVVSVAARCRYCAAVFLVRRPLFGGHTVPSAFVSGPHKRRGARFETDSARQDAE
jgi:hypothetical protein